MLKTFWRWLVTHTKHLKIMVDYDLVDKRVIEALRRIGSVDVKTIIECGFEQDAHDKTLVAATDKQRRLLLTANYRNINEHRYEPCNHGGIILIKHPRPTPDAVYARMKAFCQSGHRSLAKRHVTYLKEDGYTIHKLYSEVIEERY
jgi:Domain of unknown function (DUF5615)